MTSGKGHFPTPSTLSTLRNERCRFGGWLFDLKRGNRRACTHGCGIHEVRPGECLDCGKFRELELKGDIASRRKPT